VARRILVAAQEPVLIGDKDVHAAASIGIAVSGPGELSPDQLLHRADLAIYRAKRAGAQMPWACYGDSAADEGEAGTGEQPDKAMLTRAGPANTRPAP